MKLLFILMIISLPVIVTAQQNKGGYGFFGANANFISKGTVPGARVNIGFIATHNFGLGADISYVNGFGLPLLADFRFISDVIKNIGFTFAAKVGQLIYKTVAYSSGYSSEGTTGSLGYGAEFGLLLGNQKKPVYISGQYLSLGYNINVAGTKSAESYDDIVLSFGIKF